MQEFEIVRFYLRGQNLEQLGRVDEAIELYERAVEEGFDATGPYDRLIALHGGRAQHGEVIRVAEAALKAVRTYEAKRAWYQRTIEEANKARSKAPRAAPRPK